MNYQKIYEQLIQKRRNFPINKQKGKPGEVVYHHIIPIPAGYIKGRLRKHIS